MKEGDLLHALGSLSSDVYHLLHIKMPFVNVNVFVETGTLAPLSYDRKTWLRDTASKEQDVCMTRFPINEDIIRSQTTLF